MKKVDTCPVCSSTSLTLVGNHEYDFPGEDVKSNLVSKRYVRLWILFKHILKGGEKKYNFQVDKYSGCGFIFSIRDLHGRKWL